MEKIIQIQILPGEGGGGPKIYGLGEDGTLFIQMMSETKEPAWFPLIPWEYPQMPAMGPPPQ